MRAQTKELKLRLPRDLHSRVTVSAKRARRSLNAELVERIRVALDFDTLQNFAEYLKATD